MATKKEYLAAIKALDRVWRADRGDSKDNFGDGYSFAYKMALMGMIESLQPGTLDRLNEEEKREKREVR